MNHASRSGHSQIQGDAVTPLARRSSGQNPIDGPGYRIANFILIDVEDVSKEADPRDKAIHDTGRLSIEKKALMTTKILFSAAGSFISCQYKKELAIANV